MFDVGRSRTNLHEEIELYASKPMASFTPVSNSTRAVPVTLPRNQGLLHATVDAEDEAKVLGVAQDWFVSPSGYVYTTKRTRSNGLKTIYLHKIIAGGTAKHINGDRLDNSKSNLLLTRKQAKPDQPDAET